MKEVGARIVFSNEKGPFGQIYKKAHQGFLLNALRCYYSPDTYGSNAIVRERLIAIVNLR